MAYRKAVQEEKLRIDKINEEKKHVITDAERAAELKEKQHKVDKARLVNETEELDARKTFITPAKDRGVRVDDYINQNIQSQQATLEYLKDKAAKQTEFEFQEKTKRLELQTEAERAHNQLNAADRVEHYKIKKELDSELQEAYKERRRIQLEETDEWLREKNLARLDKRIQQLEEDIDGRHERLLSLSNGKETNRLG